MIRKRYHIIGRVQGVGFRYFTHGHANRIGVTGWVKNQGDGSVLCEAQGTPEQLADLETQINKGPAWGHVRELKVVDIPIKETESSFDVTY